MPDTGSYFPPLRSSIHPCPEIVECKPGAVVDYCYGTRRVLALSGNGSCLDSATTMHWKYERTQFRVERVANPNTQRTSKSALIVRDGSVVEVFFESRDLSKRKVFAPQLGEAWLVLETP